jgi:hypothetical protein
MLLIGWLASLTIVPLSILWLVLLLICAVPRPPRAPLQRSDFWLIGVSVALAGAWVLYLMRIEALLSFGTAS